MLTRLDLRGVTADLRSVLPRPGAQGHAEPVEVVRGILAGVCAGGDAAVRRYTEQFDGVRVTDLRVPPDEVRAALRLMPTNLRDALHAAAGNVEAYHRTQIEEPKRFERDGLVVETRAVPVDRAGCYVPGGRAIYPSTVLMTAIPARVAGVPEVVLCVPPDRTGRVPSPTLAAAAVAGVDQVYRIGGAQAIAAMAYGTESVPAVDVIVGPGNVYVALAKRLVAGEGRVGIPSAFAGPSEVVVIADGSAVVDHVAVDIVLQAEHGPDGFGWLITWDETVADAVTDAVSRMVAASPRRGILEANFAQGGFAVVVDGPEQAAAVSNTIAPEHLEIMTADPGAVVPLVRHAGAVFCGRWAPASVGDYVAGPSHVLPTFGSARFGQALTCADFAKHIHVVTLDEAALRRVGPHVVTLADTEGLPAHADSVRLRIGDTRERLKEAR